uniref:Alpha 1,4-glycosyltransferase domain-containing protein n=1 Tax=Lotharella globosa TaxID=91324 RepID=A0A7S4DU16_9EUKA
MTARSTILAFAGCAVALVLLKWATSSPPKTYCHVDDPDNDIDITAWQPPDDPRPIPPGSWGSVLTTPAKLEKLRDAGKLPVLESGVPKVIHQTWPSRDTSGVAAHYRKWSASWGACHPDWLHVLWDDCDIRRLFAKHLPDFLPVYDAYPNPVQRADIFRCLVLKEYGGLYADMDYECTGGVDGPTGLNPPQDSPQGACKVFIVNSPDPEHDGVLQNAFMASVPEHPYWTAVFDLAVERRSTLSGRIWGEIPIQNTGPGLVSDAYTMLPEGEVKTAVCGLNNTEFSGQALGQAPNAIHRNAGSWCACRFPAINWACWKKCKEKKKTYVPSMYRDLTRYKRSIDKGEKLSDKDQATWDQYGHLFQSYYDKYGEFEDI